MKVPKDKIMHACAGVVVATVAVSIAAFWIKDLRSLQQVAVFSSLMVGIAKEAYDYFTCKRTSEYWDVMATALGGSCVALIILTCF